MSFKPALTVKNLSVLFPNGGNGASSPNGELHALDDISFSVRPREFICFLGPSGSGKTTLLKVLAGLLQPTYGSIHFMHHHRPKIGMVFQQASLMPWRSVMDNIKLPLELEGRHASEAKRNAHEMIELVGLQGFEDSLPHDLSGGMAQRVGIARALDRKSVV